MVSLDHCLDPNMSCGDTSSQISWVGDGWGIDMEVEGSCFEDHVDIITMSIGGPGNPANTSPTAFNNAVTLGVAVTISAGNAGPWYSEGRYGEELMWCENCFLG